MNKNRLNIESRQGLEKQPTNKVLRIGIIQHGRILEERIIHEKRPVTFGRSEKNFFIVASPELPNRFEMFDNKQGGDYTLKFTETMRGRISVRGEVIDLKELRNSGEAKRKGQIYQIGLSEQARGKLLVGDSTILFQFVTPPPVQPRPQLPTAARGGIFTNIEWFITISWIVSFLAVGSFLFYLELKNWPAVSKWNKHVKLQELIAMPIVDQVIGRDQKKSEDALAEDGTFEQEKQERKKSRSQRNETHKKVKEKSPVVIAKERAAMRARLTEQALRQGLNKIIGSNGRGKGAVFDVLKDGDVGADQDALLAQITSVDMAGRRQGKLHQLAGGKHDGEYADISQLKMRNGDVDVRTTGPGKEKKIKGLVKKERPYDVGGDGALNPGEVTRAVNRRIGAIKGCYERALRRDPNLEGKITVRFTISGSGRVITARTVMNELNPNVGNCIVTAFKRFRFPSPDNGSVTVEYPFVFTPSN